MKKLSYLSIILLFVNLSVAAQDKFEGSYGGIAIGYIDAKDHGIEIESDGAQYIGHYNEPSGSSISISLGHNKIIKESILVGLEASFEKNNVDDSVEQYDTVFSTFEPCCIVKSKVKNSFYLGGRLGKIFQDDFLAYISAGAAFKNIKRSFEDTSTIIIKTADIQNGFYLGLGLEKYITENLTAKIDYKYVDVGKKTYNDIILAQSWGIQKHNYSENNFKIGINYYF